MTSLPVALRIENWRCVVVGGGRVANRKTRSLLDAGAHVTVIAPTVHDSLFDLERAARIVLHRRAFAPGDCTGARIVVAATNDPVVNAHVATESERVGALVNRADDADVGDLAFGAVARLRNITMMVATEGLNPAVARWLRDHVESTLTPTIERLETLLVARDSKSARLTYAEITSLMAAHSNPEADANS